MGREIRMVPPDWAHPRDAGGRYIPLFDHSYYARNNADPELALTPADCMPDFGGRATHLQVYENVTEGTPVSPGFPTPDALREWLVGHGWHASDADRLIANGSMPTFVAWIAK